MVKSTSIAGEAVQDGSRWFKM